MPDSIRNQYAIDIEFVTKADANLIKMDVPLHARPLHVAITWMKDRGLTGNIIDPRWWKPLMETYKQLYPSGDFSMPALLVGGVGLRDRMYLARVHVSYGFNLFEPIKCIDISPAEMEIIWKLDQRQFWRAMYSVADLWDFAYGVTDLDGKQTEADQLWRNAQSAITSTACTLAGGYYIDSSLQNACLSAELAMKGVLAFLGYSESQLRKWGHKLSALAEAIISERSTSNDGQLRIACATFPDYVQTRYKPHGLTRIQLVELAIRSQFIAADVLRRISERDLASQLMVDSKMPSRESL